MTQDKTILILGATRGLGLALAEEFLNRGWNVIGTARKDRTQLHELAQKHASKLRIEYADITESAQMTGLKSRLNGTVLDILFINAGTANKGGMSETVDEISTEDFTRVMVTNTLAPMRAAEALKSCVRKGGVIGVMSSGQGSVSDNEKGGNDVYRGSKAALNTIMRSFAAREGHDRALLLLAPGWVKTDMGGQNAAFTIDEVTPSLADTIVSQLDRRGLQYLDRSGKTIRW